MHHVRVTECLNQTRVHVATLPTALEAGPDLPGGGRLWMKRDDLTGLGMGGNKARKLEFLCGAALAEGATALITVGAGQSNHCRMTAAAGAVLGLETHLVLAGERPAFLQGNQLLSDRFGAQQHFTGVGPSQWGLLEIARDELTEELTSQGLRPYSIPIGGSTAVGALGYVIAFDEIMRAVKDLDLDVSAIVCTSSSGGTHAGLLAGRAHHRASYPDDELPEIIAIGVAKGVIAGYPSVKDLGRETLDLARLEGEILDQDVIVDGRWLGQDYAVPTKQGQLAMQWGAQNGAWVFDDVYTAKGMAGLLGNALAGRFAGRNVIFIHTGGQPEVFVSHGKPQI